LHWLKGSMNWSNALKHLKKNMTMEFDFFEYVEPDVTQRKVREFKCQLSTRDDVVGFIEHWHYSKNINGINNLL
jgi:hypothetical protein